ncbi:DUF3541 domain-containing protein [Vibrio sp. 10N.222.51.C8]|uniref:DUF3541 domain-containing protein n=1 Tax=unclassified Vibrio TaxID=2614977 RepID=UPI000C82EE10|nr:MULTISPECIES: DUF3541 domain-containing protein [unclassified Vibrio]PMK27232.1 hypothetical protein BCU05_04105 [Vibrio sp. 10N.261.54.C3]PMO01055.1 hypothetical protein BCT20_12630 [Vibrio sp. 10N.222.55.C12]PMO16392.1 hypothetical protein BCT17_07475 [Vibrio sp. 10N.222.54.F10]PMO17625.1 hypothetical protein BCT16_14590 [Vibrio sp. 10N.222.54.B6]TKF45123.1 DUF3541 domain-containing protein [Vibrio sp. F13]
MKLKTITLCTLLSASVAVAVHAQENVQAPTAANVQSQADSLNSQEQSFKQSADLIRTTYESQLYTLPAFKEGHYGLRMYRQTLDDKYSAAVWSDMARVASKLSTLSNEVQTMEQIVLYSEKRVASYIGDNDERSVRRYNITKHMPEYLYLGVDLLGSMARANEYGLEHKNDAKLREIIRRYDFSRYVTNEDMVKAWAAQLANQVYWLRQLGEQDVVDEFVDTFKKAYPNDKDRKLSSQQYGNKIYGMTHVIFGDSEYYQHQVREQDHQWIYDYFRENIDTILLRAKEDVIAEVGLTFLLAGLEDDPVVEKTRLAIQASIDEKQGMIPSITGDFDLEYGEHRNVLAIMLLDWQQVNEAPTYEGSPKVFTNIPYGLIKNQPPKN